MKILIVCSQGQNRSKYLAKYLESKGHKAKFGGVKPDAKNPASQEQVDWADVIVAVRGHIKETFLSRFDAKGKKVIELEVIDNPKRFPQNAQKLAKVSWFDFQEKYVYSELRKQIDTHLDSLA